MATHRNGPFVDTAPNMERPTSSKAAVPPSDRANIPPVPYINSYATYLSPNEKEVHPALWTSRSNTSMHSKYESSVSARSHNISRPFQTSTAAHPGTRAETPMRAPTFQTHHAYIPPAPRTQPNLPSFVETARANKPTIVPGPKTEPNLPSFVLPPNASRPTYATPGPALRTQPANLGKVPVTPADSGYGSAIGPSSFDWASSVHTAPRSTTTGSSVNINCYTAPQGTSHSCCCCCEHRKHPGRLARWKSAVKKFFKPKSDRDSGVEQIEISHWTEQ